MEKELERELEIFSKEITENLSNLDAEKLLQLVADGANWMYNQLKDSLCSCGGGCGCKAS